MKKALIAVLLPQAVLCLARPSMLPKALVGATPADNANEAATDGLSTISDVVLHPIKSWKSWRGDEPVVDNQKFIKMDEAYYAGLSLKSKEKELDEHFRKKVKPLAEELGMWRRRDLAQIKRNMRDEETLSIRGMSKWRKIYGGSEEIAKARAERYNWILNPSSYSPDHMAEPKDPVALPQV